MSWPEAMAIFTQGKAAFYTEANSLYKNATDPAKSKVSDTVGFAPFPAGPAGSKPYNIPSWALGINDASKNQANAWKFIEWATSKEQTLANQKAGVPGARSSVWANPEGTATYPKDLAEAIAVSTKTGVGHDRPLVVKVPEAREIVGQPIVDAITGKDAAASADTASRRSRSSWTTRTSRRSAGGRGRPAPAGPARPCPLETRWQPEHRHGSHRVPDHLAEHPAGRAGRTSTASGCSPAPAMVFVAVLIVFPLGLDGVPQPDRRRGLGPRRRARSSASSNYLDVLGDTDRFWPAVLRTVAFTGGRAAVRGRPRHGDRAAAVAAVQAVRSGSGSPSCCRSSRPRSRSA